MKKQNVIDLFCGAGGFSTGFEKQDFNIISGVDNNKNAIQTFTKNHKSYGYHKNIKKLDPNNLTNFIYDDNIDVVIGGPPCQGFSTAGDRNKKDSRNELYFSAIDVATELNPKIILFENVSDLKSMETSNGDKYINIIKNKFDNKGYKSDYKIYNSVDFGIGQTRKRLFYCAIDKDLEIETTDILENVNKKHKPLSDVIDVGSYDLQSSQYNEIRQIKQEINIRSVDEPAYTVKANTPNALIKSDSLPAKSITDTDYKRLNIEQLKKVQTYPKDYNFVGNKTSKYKQLGNSVPPKMSEFFAKNIKSLDY